MFTQINIPAVLLATVINFSVVTLWFSPALFGPLWMKLLAKHGGDAKDGVTLRSLAAVFLFLFIFNCGLELAANQTRTIGMADGVALGLIVWLFVLFAQIGIMAAMEKRSVLLTILYGGLFAVNTVISSALFAMWR